jgi:hypothetical protein
VTVFLSVLGLIVTVCMVWIAVQQMFIARQKLNHDLFDRRYAVYVATQTLMVACLNSIGGDIGNLRPFIDAQKVAPFLFGKEINEFLAQVWKHSATIQVFGKFVNSPAEPQHQQMMNDYHAAQKWLLAELQGSTARFYPSLNLSNIKPFPIIAVPDIETIRARLAKTA